MRLWSRQPCYTHLILIATGVISFQCSPLWAQQEPSRIEKPNGLRLRDSSGGTKQTQPPAAQPKESDAKQDAPPTIDWPVANSEATETEDEEPILIIGSADTLLASASDSEPAIFADVVNEVNVDLSVTLEIATASLSHISPYFWMMAGPTSVYLRPEPPAPTPVEPPQLASTEVDAKEVDAGDETTSIANEEPPRMLVETSSDLAPETPSEPMPTLAAKVEGDEPPIDAEANQPELIEKDVASTEEKLPRKPTPRTVRMPFESLNVDKEDATASKLSQPPRMSPESASTVKQRDPDSDKEQDEPKLDPSKRVVDRELQGVDAINASKPGAHRREIKIDDGSKGKAVPPIVSKAAIDPALAQRLQRSAACLSYYLENPESTAVRSPWAVMHALIAFGSDYEMVHGAGRVNAIGWMCHNGTCRTQRMFTPRGDKFIPNVGGGVQGHEGQFLAILAQSNVPLDYPIQIGNSKFKVEDLVRYEMATCKEKTELTFKLIGLSYYLDSNKQWRANDGKTWSIQKLIQEELAQPIVGSACGGTHRLMGFSFSVRQRQLQGQPINGQYARAAKFVKEYVAYTWQLQNPDGSLSTNWYEGRGNEPNDERKVQTSGHMLEWLMYTLPDEEINQPRVSKGIEFLLTKIYDQRDKKWPIGPRGHATRAVALYNARINEILGRSSEPTKLNTAAKVTPAPIIRK